MRRHYSFELVQPKVLSYQFTASLVVLLASFINLLYKNYRSTSLNGPTSQEIPINSSNWNGYNPIYWQKSAYRCLHCIAIYILIWVFRSISKFSPFTEVKYEIHVNDDHVEIVRSARKRQLSSKWRDKWTTIESRIIPLSIIHDCVIIEVVSVFHVQNKIFLRVQTGEFGGVESTFEKLDTTLVPVFPRELNLTYLECEEAWVGLNCAINHEHEMFSKKHN